jgi:hypothetical protein
MHYLNILNIFVFNVKHGRQTETLEGYYDELMKHKPIAHASVEYLSNRSLIVEMKERHY